MQLCDADMTWVFWDLNIAGGFWTGGYAIWVACVEAAEKIRDYAGERCDERGKDEGCGAAVLEGDVDLLTVCFARWLVGDVSFSFITPIKYNRGIRMTKV